MLWLIGAKSSLFGSAMLWLRGAESFLFGAAMLLLRGAESSFFGLVMLLPRRTESSLFGAADLSADVVAFFGRRSFLFFCIGCRSYSFYQLN